MRAHTHNCMRNFKTSRFQQCICLQWDEEGSVSMNSVIVSYVIQDDRRGRMLIN